MACANSGRHRRPESVHIDDADDGDGLAEFPKVTCSGAAMPVKAISAVFSRSTSDLAASDYATRSVRAR
jgi:hypothetical protein